MLIIALHVTAIELFTVPSPCLARRIPSWHYLFHPTSDAVGPFPRITIFDFLMQPRRKAPKPRNLEPYSTSE